MFFIFGMHHKSHFWKTLQLGWRTFLQNAWNTIRKLNERHVFMNQKSDGYVWYHKLVQFWAWNASGSFHKMYSRGKKTNSKLTVADKHRTKKGLFTQQGIRLGGLCKLTWRCYLFQNVTYEKLKESTRNRNRQTKIQLALSTTNAFGTGTMWPS